MKEADVIIVSTYYVNVSGQRTEIRIDTEKQHGGWEATNFATCNKILVKSARRLQGEVGAKRGRVKATVDGNLAVADNKPATVEATSSESSLAVGVLKKSLRAKASVESDVTQKKLSCVAAALKVLAESGQPLNATEMIAAMEAKGYWTSPGGKTPHATLYSAIRSVRKQ